MWRPKAGKFEAGISVSTADTYSRDSDSVMRLRVPAVAVADLQLQLCIRGSDEGVRHLTWLDSRDLMFLLLLKHHFGEVL